MRSTWLVLTQDPDVGGSLPRTPNAAGAHDAVLVIGSPPWAREAIRQYRARGGRARIVLAVDRAPADAPPYADDVVAAPPTEDTLDAALARIEGRRAAFLRLGATDVDLTRGIATRAGTSIGLTPTEVDLLRHLWRNRGTTVSREELHEVVWGYAPSVVSRAVDLAAHRLRPKIESDPQNPRFLVTVRGVGYRLEHVEDATEPIGRIPSAPLSLEPTTFVGRHREIESLAALVTAGIRAMTLLGPASLRTIVTFG